MAVTRLETTSAAPSPTIPGLLHQLTIQLTTLLRQELTLARTELFQSVARLLTSTGALVGGIALLYTGFLLLLVAAVFGLALVMPIWLAALGVGVVIGAVGFALVQRGRKILKTGGFAPSRLPNSLRRDKDVLLRKVHP